MKEGFFWIKICDCGTRVTGYETVVDDIRWFCRQCMKEIARMEAKERLDELKQEMKEGKWDQIIYPDDGDEEDYAAKRKNRHD